MKRFFVFTLAVAVAIVIAGPGVRAQQSPADEFTLEEIMVTAEKREVNVQSIPASVQALPGDALVEQGKVTVAQMLENVPNLVYADGDLRRGGPNSNITIRGIKRTQEPGGGGPIPSATSTYVDGIFDGIGGNYDIERVEVLRGPQGTLYGRSATGGVVSFYTRNPMLGELSGNAMAEYGSGSRLNTQGAINVPVGDKVALRAAAHYLHQGEGYRNDDPGGENTTKEARIKALFQPTEQFSALLSLSAAKVTGKTGGWSYTLTGPDEINFEGVLTDISDEIPAEYKQGALQLNYDLGDSALTYIGAFHSLKNVGLSGSEVRRGNILINDRKGDPSKTQTHEIRWASDTDSPFSWLIGANYYKYTYDFTNTVVQHRRIGDDDPNTFDAPLFGEWTKGDIKDFGIFTEETVELSDDMRITAGLRYDKTDLNTMIGFDFNTALKENGSSLNPPVIVHYPEDADYDTEASKFDNLTYKLRFEYDLTPENMLYALTATGFLPGSVYLSPAPQMGPLPGGGFGVTGVDFLKFVHEQEKLTSYELGSKNRFLNNRLQVNGAIFYLDYEGYQEAVNIKPPDLPPPPEFVILRLPVRIYGLEMDLTYLLTQYDKVSLTAGWLDAKVKSFPDIPAPGGGTQSSKQFMSSDRVAGLPDVTANLTYDHTFLLGNGSSLVPRAELRYTSSYYVGQATESETAQGWRPYLHQDSVTLLNIGATWLSPGDTYAITGYVRNATDEVYKTSVMLPAGPTDPDVTVGDPRTYGVMVSLTF